MTWLTIPSMDRLHHPLEHRVKQLAGFLGVPVGEQFHRPFQAACFIPEVDLRPHFYTD